MTPLVPNPLNQLARVGVGLLAVYMAIRGSVLVASGFSSGLQIFAISDSNDALDSVLWAGGIPLAFVLLFSIFPAWLLFRSRGLIAEKLAPVNEPSPTLSISGSDALRVGCVLLALALAIDGAARIVSALGLTGLIAWTGTSPGEGTNSLASLATREGATALVQLIAAALLSRHAVGLREKLAA